MLWGAVARHAVTAVLSVGTVAGVGLLDDPASEVVAQPAPQIDQEAVQQAVQEAVQEALAQAAPASPPVTVADPEPSPADSSGSPATTAAPTTTLTEPVAEPEQPPKAPEAPSPAPRSPNPAPEPPPEAQERASEAPNEPEPPEPPSEPSVRAPEPPEPVPEPPEPPPPTTEPPPTTTERPFREGSMTVQPGDDPTTQIRLQWDITPEEVSACCWAGVFTGDGLTLLASVRDWQADSQGRATYLVNGLDPGTEYRVNWPKSSALHTTAAPPTTTVPPEPKLTVGPGSIPASQIQVCWANADPQEAAGFRTLWRPLTAGVGFARIEGGWSSNGSGGSCTQVRGLTPGTGYQVIGKHDLNDPNVEDSLTISTAEPERVQGREDWVD